MLKKISLSDLEKIDLTQEAPIHPEWVNAFHHGEHSDHGHAHHELVKEETFTHKENEIKITTSYKVEVNGVEIMLHANFNERGTLQCHNTPYKGFKTVKKFIEALINNTPAEAIPGKKDKEGKMGEGMVHGAGVGHKEPEGSQDHGNHGNHGNHSGNDDHSNH